MNVQPNGSRLLIEKIKNDVIKTEGGVYIPEEAQTPPQIGKVVAVGPGRTNEHGELVPCSNAMGDYVIFGRYAGAPVIIGTAQVFLLDDSEILGTLVGYEPPKAVADPQIAVVNARAKELAHAAAIGGTGVIEPDDSPSPANIIMSKPAHKAADRLLNLS